MTKLPLSDGIAPESSTTDRLIVAVLNGTTSSVTVRSEVMVQELLRSVVSRAIL